MALTPRWSHTLLLAVLGTAAASELQMPLIPSQQKPLGANHALVKPVVDTDDLQDSIKVDNLFSRAKDLYAIAELSEPEYGHPTRVIGSEGM